MASRSRRRLPATSGQALSPLRKLRSYQVFARAERSAGRGRARARRRRRSRSGSPSTGLRSSSATSGMSSASRASRSTRSTSAAASAGGCPRKPATSLPGLAGQDELLGVVERERRDPELRLADQLGEDAAGAERDERAEDRILDDAGEQLGAAANHRLDEHRRADPLGGRAHRILVRRGRARCRRSRSCARPARRVLTTDREAELARGLDRLRRRRDHAARRRAGCRRRRSSSRTCGGVEPGVVRGARARERRAPRPPAGRCRRARATIAGRPPQPLGAVDGVAERAGSGLRVVERRDRRVGLDERGRDAPRRRRTRPARACRAAGGPARRGRRPRRPPPRPATTGGTKSTITASMPGSARTWGITAS